MMKFNRKKILALTIASSLSVFVFAKPVPVPIPVPVPVPAPKPHVKPAPPPPPAPKPHVQPKHHYNDVRLEGRLRVRMYHGKKTVILQAHSGDYILYPDDMARHPLSYHDLYKYEDEYVEIEGYEAGHHDEIYVTDIWRASKSAPRVKPVSPPPPPKKRVHPVN